MLVFLVELSLLLLLVNELTNISRESCNVISSVDNASSNDPDERSCFDIVYALDDFVDR